MLMKLRKKIKLANSCERKVLLKKKENSKVKFKIITIRVISISISSK